MKDTAKVKDIKSMADIDSNNNATELLDALINDLQTVTAKAYAIDGKLSPQSRSEEKDEPLNGVISKLTYCRKRVAIIETILNNINGHL